MAKKLKALTEADDEQLAQAVRTSAQQIWQAGLGAFAKAQEEGGKAFAKLVKEGTALQKRTRKLAGGEAAEMASTVDKVAGSWDKLEKVFEDRVSRSLKSLGVPTREDIEALASRIEELDKAIAALSGRETVAARRTKPATKPAAKKAAVKTAARKLAGKRTTK